MPTPVNPFRHQQYDDRGSDYDPTMGLAPSGTEITTSPISPFRPRPEYARQIDPPGLAGTFLKGVGSGALHPIRALTGRELPVEPPDGWTTGHTVAQFAGEMAGIGVSFLPFLKGTQVALKGIGLGMRAGNFVRTPGFALAEGAISGGLFELGSDTHEDLMTRIAIGAGMGVTAEVAMLGAGAAWRGRWRTTGAPDAPTATGKALVPLRLTPQESVGAARRRALLSDINPGALSMERNLHPAGASSFDEAVSRLKAIGNHQDQLAVAAARTILHFRPFGSGILTGVENPGQVMRALRKQVGWEDVELVLRAPDPVAPSGVSRVTGQVWEETTDGKPMWEILMYDKGAKERLVLAGRSEQELVDVFMGKGDRPDFDKILEIIRTPGTEPNVPVTVLGSAKEVAEELRRRNPSDKRSAQGFADYDRGDIVVGVDDAPDAVATLVHEYAHHFTFWSTRRVTGGENFPLTFRSTLFDGNIAGYFHGSSASRKYVGNISAFEASIENQMMELTYEAIRQKGFGGATTRELAKELVDSELRYYSTHTEQVSRALEVMFTNPAKARELAPDAVEALATQIHKYSPRLKMMLTRQELRNIQQVMEGFWTKDLKTGSVSIFGKLPETQMTAQRIEQYKKHGIFHGMNVRHQGGEWIVQSFAGGQQGKVKIMNPMTRQFKTVEAYEFHRPLMQNLVERTEDVTRKVRELTKKPASWLGVVIRQAPEPDEAAGKSRWAVRRAIVDLAKMDRVDNMTQYLAQNRELHQRALRVIQERAGGHRGMTVREEVLENWKKLSAEEQATHLQDQNVRDTILRDLTPDDVIKEIAELKGTDGVVFNDQGRHLIYVARQEALQMSDEVISHRWVNSVDGDHNNPWITPSQDNVMESLLREAGVGERELEYFKAINPFEDAAREVAEQEGLMDAIMRGVAEASEISAPEAVELTAQRAGMHIDRTTDGEVRLLSDRNEVIALSKSEDSIRAYADAVGPDPTMPNLEADLPIQTTALPQPNMQVSPRKPYEQWAQDRPKDGFAQRFLDSTQLFLAAFTAMENIAKSAERRGFGPAYTKVFKPVQDALVRVDNQLAGIKRDALGGRTFNEQLKLIEQLTEGPLLSKTHKQRQELYIRAIEAMSKEEIARPGGLLKRGLSRDEISLADTFESLGLQHDLPRLTGTLRMAKIAVQNKQQLPKKLAQMRRVELNPEFRTALERLEYLLDDMPDTVDGVLKELGLSQKEMVALGMIDNILSKGVDDQSLFAISRYASAERLGKGYTSKRAELMDLEGFTPKERRAVEEMEKLYKAAFEVSRLSSQKEIGGYWPHMKKWIENGTMPEEEFIRKHIPESVEWSAERVRTGELDVYMTDPVLTSAKYVRSMLMKQEFDPILPAVKESLGRLEASDPRLHGIFSEYVHEATGRPHASFRKLHEMIERSVNILMPGRKIDPRFTRDLINSIGSVANAAAIPFRPMLIARNYFQMTQMIPPRTGTGEFFEGLRLAISEEEFKEAVEKNIVTKNVLPVHATTELYGYDTSGLNRRMQRIFKKGFEWYQKPDDIGRAAAFFSAKARIAKHQGDHLSGRTSYEVFKSRAKINTYDSNDIQIFDDLWAAGRYTEASDHIGSALAREAIFRYGHANHPAGWGSVTGRLFGTFGTWPTQYKDFLLQGMTRGSTRDRLEFLAIHSAVNGATMAAGAAAGIELMSWVAFPSLNYTGGPMADLAINVIQSFGGSPTEKSLANRNIRGMFPSLEDPRSIFIPGSFFIGDLYRGATAADAGEGFMNALGVREISKHSKNPFVGIWD